MNDQSKSTAQPLSLRRKCRRLARQALTSFNLMSVIPQQLFASHYPVLIALGRVLPVRRIIEFGAGLFSTPLFLDQRVFPLCEEVLSYEDDAHWIKNVRNVVGTDKRSSLRVAKTPSIVEEVKENYLDTFSLVFVDNASKIEDRAITIQTIARICLRRTVVLVHDYEIENYRNMATSFKYQIRSKAYSPNTGVLWNNELLQVHMVTSYIRYIRRFASATEPNRVDRWLEHVKAIGFTQS
jgi:hypothetical protein